MKEILFTHNELPNNTSKSSSIEFQKKGTG